MTQQEIDELRVILSDDNVHPADIYQWVASKEAELKSNHVKLAGYLMVDGKALEVRHDNRDGVCPWCDKQTGNREGSCNTCGAKLGCLPYEEQWFWIESAEPIAPVEPSTA
jgi:hypothetical protein